MPNFLTTLLATQRASMYIFPLEDAEMSTICIEKIELDCGVITLGLDSCSSNACVGAVIAEKQIAASKIVERILFIIIQLSRK